MATSTFCSVVQIVFASDIYDDVYVDPFTIRVSADMSGQAVKQLILKESEKAFMGPIRLEEDRMNVMFEGQLLKTTTTLAQCRDDPRVNWPKPYRGSLFVVQYVKAPLDPVPIRHKYR